jgi:primosomal protein N'
MLLSRGTWNLDLRQQPSTDDMLQSLRSRSKRGISSVTDTSLDPSAKVHRVAPPDIDPVDNTECANEIESEHHHLVLLDPSVIMDTLTMQEVVATPDVPDRQEEPEKADVDPAMVQVDRSSSRHKRVTRQLYYYQRDTIDSCIEALSVKNGSKRFAVSAPAGSGKTETFISLLPRIPNRGDADKVLILVPSLEILGQVKQLIRKRHRGRYEVDVEHGGNHPDAGSDADM